MTEISPLGDRSRAASPAPEGGAILSPEALRPHYSAFMRPGRILLTGHSHQAWPDVARAGVLEAYDVAAAHVDDKWGPALACADEIRSAIAEMIGAGPGEIALGANTHELIVRFLSALPSGRRRRLVTTDGEFHSITRQLQRLEEEGVEVIWVPALPVDTLAARLAEAITPETGAVLASTVLFGTGHVVPHLHLVTEAAARHGAAALLDAYHAFGVVPFEIADFGPHPAYVVGGGYKYVQWGEGVCWLRVPPEARDRPIWTGWFAQFARLEAAPTPGAIAYGAEGAARYAGSTYDPTSHYRARAVIEFFRDQGMSPAALRRLYQRQTARIIEGLPEADILTPRDPEARGGFVSIRHPEAGALVAQLKGRGIFADARGDRLRLGPAPYVLDDEIDEAVEALRGWIRR